MSLRDDEQTLVASDEQRLGVMCLVRIREHERIGLRGGGVVGSWLWYAIHGHLHTLGAIVTDVPDIEAGAAGTRPDRQRFPVSNRCAGYANPSLELACCAERDDDRFVGVVHRPQQIRGASAHGQPTGFWQLAEQLQRSRTVLRQIARQLVAAGRPGGLGAGAARANRRVPGHDGADNEEGGEVGATSQSPQPSFREVLHESLNCNIETALVPLPPTWDRPHHNRAVATYAGELFYEAFRFRIAADGRAHDNRRRHAGGVATDRRRG